MELPPASTLRGSFGPVDWLSRSSCAGRAGTAGPTEVSGVGWGSPPKTVGTGALKSPGVCAPGLPTPGVCAGGPPNPRLGWELGRVRE